MVETEVTTEIVEHLDTLLAMWDSRITDIPTTNGCWAMTRSAWDDSCKYMSDLKAHVYISLILDSRLTRWVFFAPAGVPDQARKIIPGAGPNTHVMGYVVQNKTIGPDDDSFNVYLAYVRDMLRRFRVPNGLYIWSIKDAVLVPDQGWPEGSIYSGISVPDIMVPVLGASGAVGFRDIVTCCYDDIRYARKHLEPDIKLLERRWNFKRPVAMFRGSASGCGWSSAENTRMRLVETCERLSGSDAKLFDVGLIGSAPKLKLNRALNRVGSIRKDWLDGRRIKFMNIYQQSRYKYLLYCEGNVAAYRLATHLLSGSLMLMVDSRFIGWMEYYLKPWVHYIPIREDLSDLVRRVKWCISNDQACKEIAEQGRILAEYMLETNRLFLFMAEQMCWALGSECEPK